MGYTQTNAERNLCNCIHTVWLSTRNRKLIPYEPEALVVRFIYAQYLAGESVARITKLLNSQYPKEAGAWNPPAVQSILTNEKYRGDTCCQKRYTPDTLPLQKKRNKSQLPKYYIQESHPAIIIPTDFEKVQALLSQKRTHRSQMHSYPLTKMAVCQILWKNAFAQDPCKWCAGLELQDAYRGFNPMPHKACLRNGALWGIFVNVQQTFRKSSDTVSPNL
mgnify:CR=1 FL=1